MRQSSRGPGLAGLFRRTCFLIAPHGPAATIHTVIRIFETFWLVCFCVALALLALLSTDTTTMGFWPGTWLLTVVCVGGVVTLYRGLLGRLNTWCLLAGVAFTVYFACRGFLSEVRWLARPDIVFCLGGFITWSLVAGRFERPGQRMAIVSTLLVLAALNAGIGLYQRSVDPGFSIYRFLSPASFMELHQPVAPGKSHGHFSTGLFWNHNHYSAFLAMTAFPALMLGIFGHLSGFARLLCWGSFLLSVSAMALSGSRTAQVAGGAGILLGIAGLIFLSWDARRMRRKKTQGSPILLSATLILVLAAGSVAAFQTMKRRFPDGEFTRNLNGRDAFWELAYETWTTFPVMGAGARAYEYEERARRGPGRQWMDWMGEVDTYFVHNDFLQVLCDYGMIGLVLTGALVITHAGNGLSFIRRDVRHSPGPDLFGDNRGAITMGALTGLAALTPLVFADFSLHVGWNVIAASALFGLLANPGSASLQTARVDEEEDQGNTPGFRSRFPRMALAGVAGVSSVWLTWNSLNSWTSGDWHYWQGNLLSQQLADPEASDEKIIGTAVESNRLLLRSVTADPDNAAAWYLMGYNHTVLAEYSDNPAQVRSFLWKCVEHSAEALRRYPQHYVAAAFAARSELRLGRVHHAAAYLNRALAWGPGSKIVQECAGEVKFAGRHYAEAAVHFIYCVHRNTDLQKREQMDRAYRLSLEREKEQKEGKRNSPMKFQIQPE